MTHAEIRKELHRLIENERLNTTRILIAINHAEEQRSYAVFGYSSLFKWLVGEYKLSNGAAGRRLQAARLLRSVPAIEDKLKSGAVNLSTMCQTQNRITAQEKATGSKVSDEAKARVAEQIENKSSEDAAEVLFQAFPDAAPEPTKPLNRKLKNQKTRCPLDFDEEEMKLLKRAKELLSHQFPNGDHAKVVAYALKRLIKQIDPLAKRSTPKAMPTSKSSRTSRSKSKPSTPELDKDLNVSTNPASTAWAGNQSAADQIDNSQADPHEMEFDQIHRSQKSKAQIRREVFRSNEGGCCFTSDDGHVCNERALVQTDHIIPLGMGGDDTLENQRPLCRTHNLLMAERVYGIKHMAQFRKQRF